MEKKQAGLIDDKYLEELREDIISAAHTVLDHEISISKKLFEKGPIVGITEHQLVCFAKSRINTVMGYLGYEKVFDIPYNPIGSWFYKGVDGFGMIDFFNSQGNQYVRGWDGEGFNY